MIPADLTVNNESIIRTRFRRHRDGVQVFLKVAPEVEDFFRHWSMDSNDDVISFGRHWMPSPGGRLFVWRTPIEQDRYEDGGGFSLTHPSRPLRVDGRVNISFLRLVGASEGVTFITEDLMSKTEIEAMAERVKRAQARFYQEYLKPLEVDVIISQVRKGGQE